MQTSLRESSPYSQPLPLDLLAKIKNPAALIDDLILEQSFYEFVKAAWPLVDPKPFVDTWHIETICNHLEAVYHGLIKRLIINIPPRNTKSLITSVLWPAWCWINRPELRFLCASYAQELSIRDAVKARRLMQHDWYQEKFGASTATLTVDQNAKGRYENTAGGHRISTAVEAKATGEGGDIILVDDPHNAKEALSPAKIKACEAWWTGSMRSRLDDPATGAIVLIMQRLNVADLTGLLKKQEHFEHLMLPMLYEPSRQCHTSIGFEDPRQEEGQALNPLRFPLDWCHKEKEVVGTYNWSGQYQQRPTPLGGGIIKLAWFGRYSSLPPQDQILKVSQFWDTAQKVDEAVNAPWVCGTWITTYTHHYLVHVYRKWHDYPGGKRAVQNLALKWKPNEIVVEDKSTGSSLIQELTGLPIIGDEPESDKATRLYNESDAIEAGLVLLPETAPWLFDFEEEIENFPNSVYMDQGDMLSMALKRFRLRRGAQGIGIFAAKSQVNG